MHINQGDIFVDKTGISWQLVRKLRIAGKLAAVNQGDMRLAVVDTAAVRGVLYPCGVVLWTEELLAQVDKLESGAMS